MSDSIRLMTPLLPERADDLQDLAESQVNE